MEHDKDPGHSFSSVSELLRAVDDRLAELEAEGERKLLQRDASGLLESRVEQTRVLGGLGELLDAYRQTGGRVPEEVDMFALVHGSAAKAALERGKAYGRTALSPLGATMHEPNPLRQLADQFEAEE